MKRFLPIILAVSLTLTGCSFFSPERDNITAFFSLSESKSGAKILEDYLPAKDTTLFFALKPDDDFETQMSSVVSIPAESNPIDLGFFDTYKNNLADFGLSYEKDIRSLWEEGKGRIAYGVVKSDQDSIYLAITASNNDQYEKVYELLKNRSGYKENEYKGDKIIFNEDDNFYLTKVDDLLVISNSMDNLRNLINVAEEGLGELSLRDSEDYRRGVAQVREDYWFWLYLNSAEIPEEEKQQIGLLNYIFYGDETKVSKRIVYGAKRDNSDVFVRSLALQKDGSFELAMPFEFYLDAELPSKDLVLYIEKSNVAGLIEEANKSGWSSDVDYLKKYSLAFGLDYDKDLAPILSNNLALALYNNETILPNIVLMFDITDGNESAQKLVDKIDMQLGSYAVSLSSQNLLEEKDKTVLGDIIKLSEVDLPQMKGSLKKFSLESKRFVKAISKDENLNESNFLPEIIELYYGIVNDRLIVALYPNFEEVYGKNSLMDDSDYNSVSKILDEKGGMNLVFDLDNLYKNLARVNDFFAAQQFSGVISSGYSVYENYFKESRPFKRIYIRGRDKWGSNNMEMLVTF